MKSLTFRLGWPPTVNHYYGRTNRGTVYLKEPGRIYRRAAAAEFVRAGGPRLTGPVRVSLILSPPDRRRRDIDNVRKAVYDALSDRPGHRGVIADDCLIREDAAAFADASRPGAVEITITEIGENHEQQNRRTGKHVPKH